MAILLNLVKSPHDAPMFEHYILSSEERRLGPNNCSGVLSRVVPGFRTSNVGAIHTRCVSEIFRSLRETSMSMTGG